jgi:hypothetical protein
MVFLSNAYYSLYYNGTSLNGVDLISTANDSYYTQMRSGQLNDTSKQDDIITYTYQSFIFGLDYFYGLNDDISTSYNDIIPSQYKDLMLSTSKENNTLGYSSFIYKYLDEGHSSFQAPSLYGSSDETFHLTNLNQLGDRIRSRYEASYTLNDLLDERFPQASTSNDIYDKIPFVRYENNSAIIYLDGFLNGEENNIYSSPNVYNSNAYKTDSDALMRKSLNDIITKPNITKIILDLSRNPGGNLGALLRVLGYMSDQPIRNASLFNYTKMLSVTTYKTDANQDGNPDNDAFSNYDWYVLTSLVSYSAANICASIVKNMNLGKVIGQKSGGGACGILPLVLADGSSVVISGSNSFVSASYNNNSWSYQDIEYGVTPDIFIDYQYFYNDAALVSIINNN